MNYEIPYPDTDYPIGDKRRSWGTLQIETNDLDAFLDNEVASGRLSKSEVSFIRSVKTDDLLALQARGMLVGP